MAEALVAFEAAEFGLAGFALEAGFALFGGFGDEGAVLVDGVGGLEGLADDGVVAAAEVGEGAVFGGLEEPVADVGLVVGLDFDGFGDEEGVVADAVGILDGAFDPGEALFDEGGVDGEGAEGVEAGGFDFVGLEAAEGAEEGGLFEEAGPGDVDGEGSAEADHGCGVAFGGDGDAEAGWVDGEWGCPGDGGGVGATAPGGGDDGDGAGVEEAAGVGGVAKASHGASVGCSPGKGSSRAIM